jgi:hypothetical protein
MFADAAEAYFEARDILGRFAELVPAVYLSDLVRILADIRQLYLSVERGTEAESVAVELEQAERKLRQIRNGPLAEAAE